MAQRRSRPSYPELVQVRSMRGTKKRIAALAKAFGIKMAEYHRGALLAKMAEDEQRAFGRSKYQSED